MGRQGQIVLDGAQKNVGLKRCPGLAAALLLLVLVLLGVSRLAEVAETFSYPAELTYPNAVTVFLAREFQHARPLYHDIQQPPHVLTFYGPLTYVVPGMIGRWMNADQMLLFRIGRALSLLATMGTMALIGLWLLRERSGWLLALIGALMFATAEIAWPVSMCCRPDPAVVFLELLGVIGFIGLGRSPIRFAVVLVFVTAFLFKQSAVAGPVAIVLYLLLNGRSREGIAFGVIVGIAYAAVFLLMNLATDGLYYIHAFKALRVNVTVANLAEVLGDRVLQLSAVPFALALVGVIRRWSSRRFDSMSLFFVLSFALACLATLRDGSAENYFLGPLAVSCLIGCQEFSRWLRAGAGADGPEVVHAPASTPEVARASGASRESALVALIIALVVYLPGALARARDLPTALASLGEGPSQQYLMQLDFQQHLGQDLDELDGPVLSQFTTLNLFCERPLLLDTLSFTGLADQGIFDDGGIIRMLRNREVAAVVAQFPLDRGPVPRYQSTDWLSQRWANAMIEAGYRGHQIEGLFVYVPPPTP